MNLHLFNPENDLALGLDLENYTAPPAATALAIAGGALPLWYGKPGDMFACEGVNARWLREMHESFRMDVQPWNHDCSGLRPMPWGWSKAARRKFRLMGFDASELPDDNALARIRELSSRRSACLLGERLVRAGLQAPERVAQTLRTLEEARAYCSGHTDALFKLPWSSSGRGQIRVNGKADYRAREQALSGALRRYGFMTAEPFHRDKAVDLAHLFEARDGHVSYSGLSVFKTEANGDYAGNVLASEGRLRAMLELRFQGIGQQLDMLAEAQRQALEELSGQDYEGPMGVDMMILSDGSIVPSVELNLRMTMGHLARRFHDRYCEEGSAGTFRLEGHACGREYPGRYADGVLKEGCLRLNPPEYQTAFMAEIKE